MSQTLRVDLGDRSYDIIIDDGLIDTAGQHLAPLAGAAPLLVVTDETVAGLHMGRLESSFDDSGLAHRSFVLPDGEATKSFAELQRLIEAILETGPERSSILVALGGGVVGDIAGVAASLILRGIGFVQIPTTLLAQVDSAVGGKTAINAPYGKNLIGAFYQPRLVLSDTGVLDTLSRRERLAGYAEIVKYGLIDDPAFFEWLEENGRAAIDGEGDARKYAVRKSCAAKAAIVSGDETEQGARALLNLGHTFAHALEARAQYGGALLHGEAVAVGLVLAFALSVELGLCPAEDAARVRRHLQAVGLPAEIGDLGIDPGGADDLVAAMKRDKKVRDGRLTFILARGIGEAFITSDVQVSVLDRLLAGALAE